MIAQAACSQDSDNYHRITLELFACIFCVGNPNGNGRTKGES
jgi:hypothetical protein